MAWLRETAKRSPRLVHAYRAFRSLRRRSTRWPIIRHALFGRLRRVTPVCRDFGWERGQPLDRYYVEGFLARHADDVRGRVLEIQERPYTVRFGGAQVTQSDVLDVSTTNPEATIVADLTKGAGIPVEAFDCIIITQTLHLLYDLRAALATLHRSLKPGGVLLATFPGISKICYPNPDEPADLWGDCWRFTRYSAHRLFSEFFPKSHVTAEAHGNVLTATAFLHGLTVEEFDPQELDHQDPEYEVLITVRAVKPPGSTASQR